MHALLALLLFSEFLGACRREPIAQLRGPQIGQSTAPLPAEPVEQAGSASTDLHVPYNRPPESLPTPTPAPLPGDLNPDAGVLVSPPGDAGAPSDPSNDAQPGVFSPPGNP